MVSSSGEIEFVSENVTNYLQYSQVSYSELCCSAVSQQQIIIQLSWLGLWVDELFVPTLLIAAGGLLDAVASAAAKIHYMMHSACYLSKVFWVKIMSRRLLLPRCRRGVAMRILSVRLSVRPSVRLSVRHTRDPWQNGRKICPDLYTIRKNIYPSFLGRRMVGGGRPLLPEILGQPTPIGAKSPIFNQ